MSEKKTKTEGATKAGSGKYCFPMKSLDVVPAGTGSIKNLWNRKAKEDDEKFSITASEYHREKFAEVERGYALQARPTKESADPDDVVPAPTNLVIAVEPMDSSDPTSSTDTSGVITGNKVTITWDYPENSDGSKYKFANGFELTHTFEGEEKTVLVGTVDQSPVSYTHLTLPTILLV